ncbi:hypothetical protein AVEN_214872-1 [Araneus ventricosus]|uniref:Uncharacterized protein n=1 Tax=Araneus ventricosus TaxID=182803 RepID=A0A4Y2L6X2_ARAVE|nr:hypothetical protein AVEN_214872-1 [Araneus ventricosus]
MPTPAGQFKMSCRRVNMADRIDAPAKCESRRVTRFLQAEGWFFVRFYDDYEKPSILTSVVVFIHDNARPRNAVVTQQFLEQFKCDASDHPANSPDLATSDFHLFPELKKWLGVQSFQKNKDIQSSIKAHLT